MSYINQRPIAQGEITFFAVTPDHFATADFAPCESTDAGWIVAHSETGSHHVLERPASVDAVKHAPAGLVILRAIVDAPEGARLVNLGGSGRHEALTIPPGLYEARINRELGLDDVIRRSAD